ncbi:MAG: hypothetical protein ACYDG2_07490 [Ruminiclostridium sp.]
MKKLQILITIAFIISIFSSSVYAVEGNTGLEQNGAVEKHTGVCKEHGDKDKCDKDPLIRLENRKEGIQKEYKEGKITKEKADELTKKIDKHIVKIKEFNSLSLPQKKEHLSSKVKSRIERDVKDGKLSKEEGEKIVKDFNKDIENWDGKEFPGFMYRGDKHKVKD